ncbi:peptidoglycan-binding protein [Streptomyces sp. NPDC053048]|uniref:peptidoglycan-binding protein n=1 Tax=Streptomyces sp. NPDC053048 TaxID=3365694 RepID=UPI0037D42D49
MSNANEILRIARGEVGYHEGRSNGHWNNYQRYSPAVPGLEWSQNQAWCATFVSWCAMTAGVADLYPRTASCAVGVQWFKDRGRWSEYPAIGAQVFYGTGGRTHTGLVYDYDDTYVYTYEGNTNADGGAEGDGVYTKTRLRRSAYVYGYGYPKFSEGIKSADPAYAGEKPKPIEYEPFPGVAWFKKNPNSPIVTAMGRRLVAVGCSAYRKGPGPQWTSADRESFRKWQRKLGDAPAECDGWPGPKQWAALKVPRVS